jgi:hypothetical protein
MLPCLCFLWVDKEGKDEGARGMPSSLSSAHSPCTVSSASAGPSLSHESTMNMKTKKKTTKKRTNMKRMKRTRRARLSPPMPLAVDESDHPDSSTSFPSWTDRPPPPPRPPHSSAFCRSFGPSSLSWRCPGGWTPVDPVRSESLTVVSPFGPLPPSCTRRTQTPSACRLFCSTGSRP